MQILNQTINNVSVGESVTYKNMTMAPIFSNSRSSLDYLTLEEALATGNARVTEVSESGNVPELRFNNNCDKSILLLDGEELIGAKQNRMLNLSIMVPANSSINIPVSCVEAGRWNAVSNEFSPSGRAQYAKVRARKMEHVSESLNMEGSRCSNQSEVWSDISNKMSCMRVASRTSSANDMFDHHNDEIEDYVSEIKYVPDQCGAAFYINGKLIGLDIFDSEKTMERMLSKLVRSYAMDALEHPRSTVQIDPILLDQLLSNICKAKVEVFSAVGLGDDIRIKGEGLQGAALSVEEKIVHLCVFTNMSGDSRVQQNEGRIVAASTRRRRYH